MAGGDPEITLRGSEEWPGVMVREGLELLSDFGEG
jgi:hypothetical protein